MDGNQDSQIDWDEWIKVNKQVWMDRQLSRDGWTENQRAILGWVVRHGKELDMGRWTVKLASMYCRTPLMDGTNERWAGRLGQANMYCRCGGMGR